MDRTVAASLTGLMAPSLERYLGPYSYAYRPGRSYLDLLAWLSVIAREEDRWVLGNHDVAQAFPSVPLSGVMDAHRDLIASPVVDRGANDRERSRRREQDEQLLRLIDLVLRGDSRRERGLSQGNPYSPTAMELYMYTVLDAHAIQDPSNPPRLRYSDNLVPLSRSVPEGQLDRDRCQLLLRPHGLHLKEPTDPEERIIADLDAGETTRLLGFSISKRDGAVTLGIGSSAWDHLRTSLVECHTTRDPPRAARAVLTGWVTAMGPALEKGCQSALASTVTSIACETGFRETNPAHLIEQGEGARASWELLLSRARTLYHHQRGGSGS